MVLLEYSWLCAQRSCLAVLGFQNCGSRDQNEVSIIQSKLLNSCKISISFYKRENCGTDLMFHYSSLTPLFLSTRNNNVRFHSISKRILIISHYDDNSQRNYLIKTRGTDYCYFPSFTFHQFLPNAAFSDVFTHPICLGATTTIIISQVLT